MSLRLVQNNFKYSHDTKKGPFYNFIWVEAFFLLYCFFFYAKKLKEKRVVYHKKVLPLGKNTSFEKISNKHFHRTYFKFEGQKRIVKASFIKPLLA